MAGISEKSLRHSMWNADVTKQGAEDQLKGVLKVCVEYEQRKNMCLRALHLFDAMVTTAACRDGATWQTVLSS